MLQGELSNGETTDSIAFEVEYQVKEDPYYFIDDTPPQEEEEVILP